MKGRQDDSEKEGPFFPCFVRSLFLAFCLRQGTTFCNNFPLFFSFSLFSVPRVFAHTNLVNTKSSSDCIRRCSLFSGSLRRLCFFFFVFLFCRSGLLVFGTLDFFTVRSSLEYSLSVSRLLSLSYSLTHELRSARQFSFLFLSASLSIGSRWPAQCSMALPVLRMRLTFFFRLSTFFL